MAAIRAEMPRISVAFASVGLGHGVFKNGEMGVIEKARAAEPFRCWKPKARAGYSSGPEKVLKDLSINYQCGIRETGPLKESQGRQIGLVDHLIRSTQEISDFCWSESLARMRRVRWMLLGW